MAVLERSLSGVDKLTEWAAKFGIWLIVPLILTVVYEVVARYAFNAPTIWHFEVSRMIAGVIFFFTSAYIMVLRRHVRVDIIYERFSPRTQAIIDVVLTLILVFPLWAVSIPYFIEWTAHSWEIRETSSDSAWRVIMYPIKTMGLIGIILLVLAITVSFIRDIKTIVKGER
jgi:TRAP-type mannitol/chloroaromatic compound transport system permease small subunit